jgi:DNA topoisomerase-2
MEGEIITLDDREHLLLRPDTLCGSTAPAEHAMHVFQWRDGAADKEVLEEQVAVTWKTLVFAPAVKNLFQEILTNALDRQFRDPTLKKIEVFLEGDWIRVKNDGQGVPVVFDEERDAWKPTIAFSHFRSGTNFADGDGPRFTAGRNGYGCKATNVFSRTFEVHTGDPRTGKQFIQSFSNNMASATKPVVKAWAPKKGFTEVKFLLDWARLGCPQGMTQDVRDMLTATTINASACLAKKVTLHLNGVKLGVKHLRNFGAVFGSGAAYDVIKDETDMVRWEVCAVKACREDQEVGIGFVNSLECSEGTHMNYALNRIVASLETHIKSKFKKGADFTLSPAAVKKRIFITVRLMVDSPEFSSQTKEKLTTAASRFSFQWAPTAAFVKAMVECGLVQDVYQDVLDKELATARKTMTKASGAGPRRLFVADKYDAATALRKGGRSNCSLLVTEGDSAKALAVAGLAVVGREHFGIFALKGKPLNVRNATVDAISKNKEIATLLQILGLTLGKVVTSLDQLTYKKLVIFSDQDPDGAHIGGLILNVIHALFPSVLTLDPSFVQRFPTPLVRVVERRTNEVHCFYARPHFDEWAAGKELDRYTIKYFKGLGTSTSALAREYFSEYQNHLVNIVWSQASDDIMAQMFGGDNAASRRLLLQHHYDPQAYVDYGQPAVTYTEFIHKEVLPYSNYSNERNIPSVVDGLKPVQRKALFTMLEKNIVSDVKVAQVAAVIAAHTMYHHGEQSLVEAVVGMAQDHVGVSNLNLFRPEGQFGTRLDPPSVHSAPRYIFTGLDAVTRCLFSKADDPVLQYREEEGTSIEPSYYLPVIPMVLVNGAFGIGTGWSTFVPMYNPMDLVSICRSFIHDGAAGVEARCQPSVLLPWYDGFKGTVTYLEDRQVYRTRGRCTVVGVSQLHITELPVGTWTHAFVEEVEKKMMGGAEAGRKKAALDGLVVAIDKCWTDSVVDMTLHCDMEKLAPLLGDDGQLTESAWDLLGLQDEVRLGNMHLHNASGKLQQYENVASIVVEYATERLSLYTKRQAHQIQELEAELVMVQNKLRFIQEQVSGSLELRGVKEQDAVSLLVERGFAMMAASFDYLLNLPIKTLTAERVAKLRADLEKMESALDALRATTPQRLWLDDLERLEAAIVDFRARKAARYAVTEGSGKRTSKVGTKRAAPSGLKGGKKLCA